MSRGLCLSIVFHTCLIAIMLLGWPHLKRDIVSEYAIVMDVVPVSELTNVKIKEVDRKDDIQKQLKPKSVEVEKAKKQSIPIEEKNVEKKAEKIPEKIITKKELPEKVKEEQKKAAEPQKKKDDSFEKSVLKSLEEEKNKKEAKKLDNDFKDIAEALKGETNKDYNPVLPMSISELDAITAQIGRHWNKAFFNGAADTKDMHVVIKIKLDLAGNVLEVNPRLESNSSPYYTPFWESAVRAVKAASPLTGLSKDKFSSWREIEFTFYPDGIIH